MTPDAYRWVEHTGELELSIEAPTQEGVFAHAAAALGELLGDDSDGEGDGREPETRAVSVEAGDRATLLAAFLDELIFLAESERLVPCAVRQVELGAKGCRAEVGFTPGDPPHLVKAVTYHRLSFDPGGGGYRATAVLDV